MPTDVLTVAISNVNQLVHYYYTDSSGQAGQTYFYRLKIIDNTGVVTYSKTIQLTNQSTLLVEVNPNPFRNQLTVSINNRRNEKTVLTLMNMNGVTVNKQETKLVNGINRIDLKGLERLTGGVYFLRVQTGDELKIYKLVKL